MSRNSPPTPQRPSRRPRLLAAGVLLAVLAPVSGQGQEPPQEPRREPSPSAVQREIAEAEAALAEIAELERQWSERGQQEQDAVAVRLEEVVTLDAELRDAEPGSEAAAAIFDRSLVLLQGAVDDLSHAIRSVAAPSEVPRDALPSRRTTRRGSALPAARPATNAAAGRLEELERQRQEAARELVRLEHQLRLESVERYAELGGRIWLLRQAALDALPEARHQRIFSLSPEGVAESRRELEVYEAALQVQRVRLRDLAGNTARKLLDFFTAAAIGGVLLRLAVVVLLWRWAQGRRTRVLEGLKERFEGGSARSVLEVVEALSPWGVFLLAVAGLHWAFGPEGRAAPLVMPLILLVAIYGGYRLGIDLLSALLVAGARYTAFEITPERRARLGRSVRLVLLMTTLVVAVLATWSLRLGHGVIYAGLAQAGTWLMALTSVLVLIPWRVELADACLAMRAEGWWAQVLRRSRDRRLGALVAPFSFVWISAHGLASMVQDVASGYERTRRATAYLARRRIEKEARERGYAECGLEALPEGVAAALDEAVTLEDLEALDHFPGLDRARATVAAWRRGEEGGAFLLTGEAGIGKRAWVDRLAALEPAVDRLALDHRLLEPSELFRWLGTHLLGREEHPSSWEELAERLLAGEPRIVVLEGLEHLFLARVGGYAALGEMAKLTGATRRQIFWLLSMEGLAWNHLRASSKELSLLRRGAELPAWSHDQIRGLLRHRLAAGGFEVSFAELMGSAAEDAAARGREGEKAYANLLWDFSGGNPRVALHHFLRSLVPAAEDRLEVRLFRSPPEEELTELDDEALFMLAAVARHGSLAAGEAAALGYQPGLAELLLGRLLDLGALVASGERLRVSTGWQSTVLRLLRRRNILVT